MAAVDIVSNAPADQLRVGSRDEPSDNVGPVNPLAVWRSVVRTNLIAVAAFS